MTKISTCHHLNQFWPSNRVPNYSQLPGKDTAKASSHWPLVIETKHKVYLDSTFCQAYNNNAISFGECQQQPKHIRNNHYVARNLTKIRSG